VGTKGRQSRSINFFSSLLIFGIPAGIIICAYSLLFHVKNFCVIPNPKTDKLGYATSNPDEERDMGAKGGPTISLGQPDDRHTAAKPYEEDTQTQLAAKSTEKKNKTKTRKTKQDNAK